MALCLFLLIPLVKLFLLPLKCILWVEALELFVHKSQDLEAIVVHLLSREPWLQSRQWLTLRAVSRAPWLVMVAQGEFHCS